MGQINYKTEYAESFAAAHAQREPLDPQDCPLYGWGHVRPHLPVILSVALAVSLFCHAALIAAVELAPVPPPAIHLAEHHIAPARVTHLNWDLYAGQNGAGSAAALDAADGASAGGSPTNGPTKPTTLAAASVHQARPHRNTPPKPRKNDTREEDTSRHEMPTAPVKAIVDADENADVQIPDEAPAHAVATEDAGGAPAPAQPDTTANGTIVTAPGAHGNGRGTGTGSATGAGGAVGTHRRAGGHGDGTRIDMKGLRRGHLHGLNRAIRTQNPCTRQLEHRGLSGNVVLGLTQNPDGSVDEVRVLRSSGRALIDKTAVSFIREQHHLPAPEDVLLDDVWKIGLRFECGG